MSRSSSYNKLSDSRKAKQKEECRGDYQKGEGRGRWNERRQSRQSAPVSPLKGQWFMLSAVVITGAFLVISGIFSTYSSIDPSVVARSNEDFHFSQIKDQFGRVVSRSSCANLDQNLREFTAFAKKDMAKSGYLLYINYTLSGCSVANRGFMLASERTVIVQNINANDIIPGVFVSNSTG